MLSSLALELYCPLQSLKPAAASECYHSGSCAQLIQTAAQEVPYTALAGLIC